MGEVQIISESPVPFEDRIEAGQLLAGQMAAYRRQRPVVLGIPRGGAIVAAEVAKDLQAELDVILTRKLGSPLSPELAMGAVAENGSVVLDDDVVRYSGATPQHIYQVKTSELQEIARRSKAFRAEHPRIGLEGRLVIIIDDGVATGSTMKASLIAAAAERPLRLVCALPVGPAETVYRLAQHADEIICLRTPPFFQAVGQFYRVFTQTTDEEVLDVLRRARGSSYAQGRP